eukprot:m.9710 g.9710  ORF g.9710 m.9710 type:complete len:52 (+) comp21575_c0_seq2:339-494(+)
MLLDVDNEEVEITASFKTDGFAATVRVCSIMVQCIYGSISRGWAGWKSRVL